METPKVVKGLRKSQVSHIIKAHHQLNSNKFKSRQFLCPTNYEKKSGLPFKSKEIRRACQLFKRLDREPIWWRHATNYILAYKLVKCLHAIFWTFYFILVYKIILAKVGFGWQGGNESWIGKDAKLFEKLRIYPDP